MPDAITDDFPWGTGARIGVRFDETTVEVVSLLCRELEAFIFFGDAVAELLDELEFLGGREPKEFLAKGTRCHAS